MDLYSLRIQGLRKHSDTTIYFSDSTFLIGENNVGKSSVLVAIDYLLNIKAKIPEEEYYSIADESGNVVRKAQEIILTAEFRNLPEDAYTWRGFKGRIIPYESQIDGDSGLSFIYRKTFSLTSGAPKIEVREYNRTLKEEFSSCKTIKDYLENGIVATEIPEKLQQLPKNQTLKKAEKDLLFAEVDSLYLFSDDDTSWVENPGGIPQNVLSKLPTFLLIPAQDKEEEISGGTGTLRKTLDELFREVRDSSENYRQAQHYLDLLQAEMNPENPETEISKMMKDLNGVVSDVFPSASISASANLSDPDATIKPSFSIQMSSNIATNTSLQGTGMIRSAVFALLRYKSMRDAKRHEEETRSLIIGFEEPELYLHPNAISKIKDTIYRLAENPNNQIICTTHSPYMIDISRRPRQILNNLSLMYLDWDGLQGESITVKPFNVTDEFRNLQSGDKDYVKMLLRVDDAIAKSFFVKNVLIVEGDTEQIVINETLPFLPPTVASRIVSDWHIIRARGRAAIIPLIKYLKAMAINIYVIHDGDYGTEGAEKFNPHIKNALDNDSHLVVLDKCVEDALGYPAKSSDKPLHAYTFIRDNWTHWTDISENWRACIEKIFNEGNHIIIKQGIIEA